MIVIIVSFLLGAGHITVLRRWSTENRIYFEGLTFYSSGCVDSFFIENTSQHAFLDSNFLWDLQFHFTSKGCILDLCLVYSTDLILHWTVPGNTVFDF